MLVGPFENDLDPLLLETERIIKTNKNIVLTGWVDDPRPYFAISNVLVFPSYREGFPNVVMQSGAMGIPSIVSNINGCNEIIKENENGVIIPVKNVQKLTEAMEKMISKFHENDSIYDSIQIRESITKRFERKMIWDLVLNEYQYLEGQ